MNEQKVLHKGGQFLDLTTIQRTEVSPSIVKVTKTKRTSWMQLYEIQYSQWRQWKLETFVLPYDKPAHA